jgi:hypothetical protein
MSETKFHTHTDPQAKLEVASIHYENVIRKQKAIIAEACSNVIVETQNCCVG